MPALSPDTHDELVRRIYDHATDDELTSMFLPWVSAFSSIGSHSILLGPNGQVIESSHAALVVGVPREYEAEWRAADPRMALAVASPGRVFSDVDHIPSAAFERSDVYHAVLRPYDVRYTLFGTLPLSRGYTLAQAVMRRRAQGAFEADEVAAMERLWPHLQRGFELRLQLAGLRSHVASLESALDALPAPLFVLDGRGRVLHHNAAASTLLAERGVVCIQQQQLVTSQSRASAHLRCAVAQAVAYADMPSQASRTRSSPPCVAVEVPRPHGAALSLVVHPVRPRVVARVAADARARALVVVHDPASRARVDRGLLERIHGLTPTEAELAATLAEGKSLAEFADARGCTEGTARVHLKRVFEKTGTRRQAELVHRILASAALHAVER